jgi:acyl-coenzyme A synthetase/AMP-(fatty) acid ligase
VLKQETDSQSIIDYVTARVAPHKRIRYLEFVDKIPKSPSGKILRRVLVDAERAKAQAL